MYQAILIDDKSLALESAKHYINWHDFGFELAGSCSSGIDDALNLCAAVKPDLLLVTLQADPEEGLSLIRSIREQDFQAEIIILTDLDDFHVAQAAIDLGAHSILLSPLEPEQLTKALHSVHQKISKNRANLHFKKTYLTYNGAIFLHKLLHNPKMTDVEFEKLCSDYSIILPEGNFLVALLHVDPPRQQTNFDDLHMQLAEIVNKVIVESQYYVLANILSPKNIPIMMYEEESDGLDGILSFLNTIREEFRKLGGTLTIGISLFFRQITGASRALEQATNALESVPHLSGDRIVDYSNEKNERIDILQPFTQKEIYSLCNSIRKFDIDSSVEFINNYFAKVALIKNLNLDELRSNILELTVYILKENVQNPTALSDVLGRSLIPSAELQSLELVREIREWILNLITILISHPDIVLSCSYSPLVKNAIIYTMANYNTPLTAAAVAQHFFVSPNHFMRVFKKEVGKTFGQYVAEYRVKIAKIMLKTNDYKIYEVGQMVGYPNVKYFNKIFKKYTGHVPTYYTTQTGDDDEQA